MDTSILDGISHFTQLIANEKLRKDLELLRIETLAGKPKERKKMAQRLLELGFLNKNFLLFYEEKEERFIRINVTTKQLTIFSTKQSVHSLIVKNFKCNSDGNMLNTIPIVNRIFSPHKNDFLNVDEFDQTTINTFQDTKPTALRHTLKDDDRISSINWESYPSIRLLFANLFRDDEGIDYVTNWLSTMLNTMDKVGTSLIIKGAQGTGKGIFFEQILKPLYSSDSVAVIGTQQLQSKFNEFLEDKMLIYANEIKGDFRAGNTAYDRLKSWVTDRYLTLSRKGLKEKMVDSFSNWIISSNHDAPIQIEHSDRRYSVFVTGGSLDEDLGIDTAQLVANIQKEREAFYIELMSLKYCTKQAKKALDNEAKKQIVETTMSKAQVLAHWIYNRDEKAIIENCIDDINTPSNSLKKHLFGDESVNLDQKLDELKKDTTEALKTNEIRAKTLETLLSLYTGDTSKFRSLANKLKDLGCTKKRTSQYKLWVLSKKADKNDPF